MTISVENDPLQKSSRRYRIASITKKLSHSFFRQARLAQAVKRRLQHRLVLDQPFDGKLGIDTASFGQGGLCLIHFTFERTGSSQI